jgi:uncharacterized membrane protein
MSLLPFHVTAGVMAILSGFVALYALKGATLHRRSGTVFVYAMLVMSLSGAVAAIGRLVTAYLVITALNTVRPRTEGSLRVDRAAMVAAFAIGAASLLVAITGGARAGMAPPLVMFALVALFAGEGDRRMIRAGGLKGAPRLRRHLWRMCTALFIAAASFFLGPVRRIPEPLRIPALRLIPFVALATMAYWLWRYHRKPTSRNTVGVSAPEAI